jgi:hypothetical protein
MRKYKTLPTIPTQPSSRKDFESTVTRCHLFTTFGQAGRQVSDVYQAGGHFDHMRQGSAL